MNNNNHSPINCMRCRHFYITWNPNFPRACRLLGFKTKHMPSVEVHKITGLPCDAFEDKKHYREFRE